MVKSAVTTDGNSSTGIGRRSAARSPREQFAHAERLRHVVVGAGIERTDLVELAVAGRQHHDRHRRPPTQRPDDLHARDARQAEVEHHQIGLGRRGQLERTFTGRGEVDVVPARTQVRTQRSQQVRLVLDAQDAAHDTSATGDGVACPESLARRSASCSAAGRVITTVSPPPGVSRSSIVPPIAATKRSAMARPSPRPPLAPESSSRWNGCTTTARCAGGMPGPWSITCSCTVAPRR